MISLSSSGIKNMSKVRSELCRIPSKPNGAGYIQILTKAEIAKLQIPSPNIGDGIKMAFGFDVVQRRKTQVMNFARAV